MRHWLSSVMIVLAASSAAADFAADRANAIPADVSQVVSAGSWTENNERGFFRAILAVEDLGATTRSHVVVQILMLPETGSPRIRSSTAVTEVSAKSAQNVSMELYAEKEGEALVRIAAFDETGEETGADLVTVKIDGTYTLVAEPKAALPDSGANVPSQPKP